MDLENWPDCPVEGCTNKICLALDSQFCFPHTPGNKHVKNIDIDVRRVMREKRRENREVSMKFIMSDCVSRSDDDLRDTRLVNVCS